MGLGKGFKGLFAKRKPKASRQPPPPVVVSPAVTNLFVQESPPPAQVVASLPRFQATAGDQLDRRLSGKFTSLRMKLRNAFTPSQPVADRRMFAGRMDVLTTMIRSIEDQRLHVVLYGERGIGKTSLLHMLSEAAADARYIVVYSSCGAASNFEDTFKAAAIDVPLLFHTGFAPTTSEAERGSTLADILSSPLTPRQFADVCVKLTGTRVLIILDEFDRCESVEFRRDIAELIKNLSDRSVRVQLVIAGVAADLTELVEHIPSIRRNIFALRVPLMGETEVRAMVTTGENASGVKFDEDASAFIVSLAHGSPYIASLLCHHAGLAALDAGRTTVTAEDGATAARQALTELSGRIGRQSHKQIDKLLASKEADLLHLLAGAALHVGGEYSLADIEAAAKDASMADIAAASRLTEGLSAAGILLQPVRDEDVPRFAFTEEGAPAYLWMLYGLQRFERGERPAAPVETAGARVDARRK